MDQPPCQIDDFGPVPAVRPASVAELGEIVRQAAAGGQALYPLGGRTQVGLGLPPVRPGLGVDLRGLTQIIDYPARDMTITLQAGTTVAALQETLRAEGQQLPVDVPLADRATLGGALAVNVSGPRRLGHGTLRDYVIGISVVNDEGHEAKAGGRVVKNVAGYDLCKLHVGALGTLGIITQATLKLRPLPEERAVVLVACQTEAVGPLLDAVHQSRARPVAVDLLNQPALEAIDRGSTRLLPVVPWLAVIGFEEKRETVGWQVQQLVRELPVGLLGVEARMGSTSEAVWRALTEFRAWPESALTWKANLLPRAVAGFLTAAAALPDPLLLQAQAGSGIVIGHAPAGLTVDRARTMLTTLSGLAAAAQGNLIVLHCPAEWKRSLPIWGLPRGDRELMREIKSKLDPGNLFNPGRFVV